MHFAGIVTPSVDWDCHAMILRCCSYSETFKERKSVKNSSFHSLKINKSNFRKIKKKQTQDVLKCHKVVLHDKA